jgi:hypothetical protein
VEEDDNEGGEQASEMSLHVSNAGWTPGLPVALQSAILGTIQDTWAFSHASASGGCAWPAIC